MNTANSQKLEKHQILPDYNLDMSSSNYFDSDDGFDDGDVMVGFYQSEKNIAPPKKPLPKTKKLRVLVKRLSKDVVQRYLKQKYAPKVGSSLATSHRPLYNPAQKPQLKQQTFMNKPQGVVRQFVKSVPSNKPSAAVLDLMRNNFKQQTLAGQKLSGVVDRSPAASKSLANPHMSNVNIRQIKRPLQTEYVKISSIKTQATTGYSNTKGPSAAAKNSPIESKNFIEMQRDTIQVKREIKRTALTDFLSNFEQVPPVGSQKSVDVKKVIVRSMGNSKSHDIISKNTVNLKNVINKAIVMDKQQPLVKKVGSNIVTNSQQKQGDLNKTPSDTNRPIVKHFITANKNDNKSFIQKPLQIKDLDKNSGRQLVKQSININQLSTKIVKQPKIVKVPISKLIKIPQGITICKSADNPVMAKPLNNVRSFERVNIANVVKHANTVGVENAIKMPESFKLTGKPNSNAVISPSNVIKIPQSIKISKVVKSPEMVKIVKLPNTQNMTAVKLLDTKNHANVAKSPDNVIISKVVKVPEVGSANGKLNALNRIQIEADNRNMSKRINTSLNSQAKGVQTKFTCNDNICGIIDTAEFNINCFYCYDVFPLRKWPAFIRHMKSSHRLEEQSHKAADRLLMPKNIIPFGMKSKEVQVHTLKGRDVLGNKRKATEPDNYIMNSAAMDDMESMCDDSQLDNDLEMALNCTDEDDVDEIGQLFPARKKIVKLENEDNSQNVGVTAQEVEKTKQTFIETTGDLNANPSNSLSTASKDVDVSLKSETATSDGLKFADHTLFKNKIINLPSNIKIVKKLTAGNETIGETIKSKGSEQNPDNSQPKMIVVQKVTKPITTIKTEDAPESTAHNTTMESIDSFSEDIIMLSNISKTEDTTNTELGESRLDDTLGDAKNDSLDISKTDVEQNVKIEPDFDNESADETALLRTKYEAKRRTKKYINSKKNQLATQKPRPIPPNLLDSDDEMPSNDENEDELPSPTNGCGILFGLTNRSIVKDFITELQKYPELWQFNRSNDVVINYNESIRKLYQHLNDKFNLDMTDFEVRLSIQRIKYWYCRTLQKLEAHKKNPLANKGEFRHTFVEYFKMLDKFLSCDSNFTKDLVLGKRFQMKDVNELNRYPKWMIYKEPAGGADTTTDDKCSLARDLEFSEDCVTDQEEEEHARSLIPFKSEMDTSAAPPDPFICDICFVDFNSMVELTRHRVRHFPPQYACSICKRMHYSSYIADKCSHGMPKKKLPPKEKEPSLFVCEICGVSYKSVGTLNYHKKDKHYNMRHKCPVCKFTSISNYRMLQHQKKRHVVEFGTCEEVAKKTRARTDSKVPFSAEARREFEWRREMRKKTPAGELFYGCFKCKLVLKTRKEKVQHNREKHPITESTVVCLLCKREKALFSNSNSARRHYTDVHKVPWDEIDDLVKRTKPLFQELTPLEVDQLKSSENPCEFVTKILAKKLKVEQQNTPDMGCEISRAIKSISDDMEDELNHSYDPFKFENSPEKRIKLENILLSHEEESFDDEYYQSSFFNDIGIDHDYDEMQDDSFNSDDDDAFYDLAADYGDRAPKKSEQMQHFEYQDDDGNEHYIIEECVENDQYADIDVGQPGDQQLIYEGHVPENGINEEEIVEEIVEYDFMEDVMDDRY